MRIAWTKPAIHDLNEAAYYVRADNLPAASRMLTKIRASIHQLTMFPMLGRIGWQDGTRELVLPNTPYAVVYRVEQKRVEILAVLHGARGWKGE